MSISIRKIGVLAVAAAVLVVLAALRPTAETPTAEADLATPGGIAALPSAIPAFPTVLNQGVPAIIRTGASSIVVVWCLGPGGAALCPDTDGSTTGAVTLEIERLSPSGDPAASFAATGGSTLVVTDNSGADMDAMPGTIAVQVNAAAATLAGTQGVNEILKVTATDETGDMRSVNIVVVDTVLAWGPTGAVSTASQEQPTFVSYACDTVGRSPLAANTPSWLAEATFGDADGNQGLDDMYDAYYAYNLVATGWGSNTFATDADISDVWCGGDTAAGLFDDFVDFQTDKGIFSVDPIGASLAGLSAQLGAVGLTYPPVVDLDCGEGENVDAFDVDALAVWNAWGPAGVPGALEGGCDADGWRNGVVTSQLLGSGDVGVATINAQQGGGIAGPPRTINVTFVGEGALSLFIEAPASIGIQGDSFAVILVDQDGRPVGDETVECTVEPAGGALTILPQTGTTGAITSDAPGEVSFDLIPTGASVIGGEELTLTCVLDRDRSVSATETVSLSMTPELEVVDLVAGCNPVASTWADGTAVATVAGAVAPADALDAIWAFDPGSGMWQGFSPDAPQASDLASVDMLDAIFMCVDAAATVSRPVI